MAENKKEVEVKECQLCHQILTISSFYKRKDRNGEYNWTMSYCKSCKYTQVNNDREQNIEKYRTYQKEYGNNYYHDNKDKVRIIQKRYYYKKLSPERQVIYKEKLQETYPEWVDQICI